ncbi:hypothetical protein ACLOJK_026670 [Asimina triloba]
MDLANGFSPVVALGGRQWDRPFDGDRTCVIPAGVLKEIRRYRYLYSGIKDPIFLARGSSMMMGPAVFSTRFPYDGRFPGVRLGAALMAGPAVFSTGVAYDGRFLGVRLGVAYDGGSCNL